MAPFFRGFIRYLVFTVLLFGLISKCMPYPNSAAGETCAAEMSSRAVQTLPQAREDWKSLLRHREKFASCDDGELAEAYTEAVVGLFAYKWDQLDKFAGQVHGHANLQKWALRHIDSSASKEDLKKISSNASSCRNGLKHLCKIIKQTSERALRESLDAQ